MKIENLEQLDDFLAICQNRDVAEVRLGDLIVVFQVKAGEPTSLEGLEKSALGSKYDDPYDDPDLYPDGKPPGQD